MINLREQVTKDLDFTLKGEFALPVTLVDPDAVEYQVQGQVIYDTLVFNPDTGQEIIVHKPVVTLKIEDLSRIPADGEKWIVKIPEKPEVEADKETYFLDKPSEDGKSIGFIRLYLTETEQI